MVGISYEKADAQLRGDYAFFPEWISSFSEKMKLSNTDNFYILSTCNRTEIYFLGIDYQQVIKSYCEFVGKEETVFLNTCTIKKGIEAVDHFFRVSAGLESQILGDFEVISQIKIWAKKFKKQGKLNSFLERLINTAIQISKEIKTQTNLSSGVTSVSYAAVQYILANTSKNSKILLYGVGKIGRNTCENLYKHTNNKEVTLINRTPERAELLSEKLKFNTKPIQELSNCIAETDILIVATGAKEPTIRKEYITDNKPLIIIDLSIPENVAPDVNEIENVTVINVDKLSEIVGETITKRKEEIPNAERIIKTHLAEFSQWSDNRKYAPEIQAFKEKLLFLQHHELKNLQKKVPSINGKETMLSEKLVQKLTNRFALHLLNNQEQAEESIQLIQDIFQLEIDSDL